MGFDEEDELGTVPDDETRSRLPIDRSGAGIGVPDTSNAALSSRVAAPGVAKEMPAASLRGLGAVAPNPDASTADLESRGLASRISPAPIAAPSATQSRTATDQAELERLQKTGSGISQIHNSVGRGALRGLEAIGDAIAPRTTARIPGTEAHHNALIATQEGRLGEDTIEAGKEAEAAKAQAEAEEAQARARSLDAATAAAGQPKPKEEKYDTFTGYTDIDGTPLLREENSGNVVRASDKKPPTGFKAAAPKNEKPDNLEQQLNDSLQAVADAKTPEAKTAAQAKYEQLKRVISEYAALTGKPEHEPKQLAIVNGKVVELKPGMEIPQGATDAKGNPIGVKQPNADEIKRADLAKNLNENLDELEEIVTRRPDLFGKFSGRFTKAKEWLGSNDPDVAALKGVEDRLGMVIQSSHGMRSAMHVTESANSVMNSYKNGADAMKRAISDARKSAQTFLNDVKPNHGANETGKDVGEAPAGKAEGSTGKLDDGTKVIVKNGRLITQ